MVEIEIDKDKERERKNKELAEGYENKMLEKIKKEKDIKSSMLAERY
jgi:hypothetical protein